jgi:benzoyl-CoA reductase/2-hydroxyglutaryl-CoA dehydratase subunit BcrC/BadD/HgdB
MVELPENFVSYNEARKAGFIKIKNLKDKGTKVVGVFCSYAPRELVLAADAVPIGLCGTSNEPVEAAEKHLPKNLCPLIKSSYGHAITDTCPYFYYSDLILAESTCDGKKKMYELLSDMKPVHMMYLPNGQDADLALEAWMSETERFKKRLEDDFGVKITDEKLKAAIKLKNRERKACLDFYELGKLVPPPVSGYELSNTMDSLGFSFDVEENIAKLEARTAELKKYYEENLKGTKTNRPRILVTGCPSGGVREKVIRQIELLGADIVAFENCNGPREKMEMIDEEKEPIRAMAEKYLNIPCAVMSPNRGRYETLEQLIHDYQIDGVVDIVLHACHCFAIESHFVKELVTEKYGLPYLNLTTDYSESDSGQISTRISAFLEMMA